MEQLSLLLKARGRRLNVLQRLALLLIIFTSFAVSKAQNVTISPNSGKLVAGLTYDIEIGFEHGWSSLWRHNQLPLTLTVSDKTDLVEGGQLKDPAGNISLDANQGQYVIMGGKTVTTSMNISLPKGFRFTGYRIVLLNNINDETINTMPISGMRKIMYETDATFNINTPKARTEEMGAYNEETKEYVIARTSNNNTDMGNNLYFYFWREKDGFYGATIKYCELYFTAEGPFQADVAPGSPSMIINKGVNMVDVPFATSKLDLGIIKPNVKNGKTYFSYDYRNVKELMASNHLYQENAVTSDKKLPAVAGEGDIQAVNNNGKIYYAVGNNTYYIETPTSTKSQDGTDIPLGYRITGAKVKYNYGTASAAGNVPYDGFYITARGGSLLNKKTYYLQTNGKWDQDNKVVWRFDGTNRGKLYSEGHYLFIEVSGNKVYVKSTSDKAAASIFEKEGKNIKGQINHSYYYLSMIRSNDYAKLTNKGNNEAELVAAQGTTPNPAFTPSPYTLKVYATDKNSPYKEVNVTAGAEGSIEVPNLNNDAVKFEVSGLAPGTKALVTFELTLEALDPFVNSIDIICHSLKADGPTLMQQFTSNDFQVSGGKFLFYVPKDFMGDQQKCKFTFENLYSKYGDSTYPKGTATHHARYYFAKSDYYNSFGDGKQYTTTGNENASDKINTKMCGDQPFKYSNIDELNNNNTGATPTTLKEYPYSEALYRTQGGTFTENIEIAINNSKECYLFTGDETRWNVAPTTAMEHRYYAYYLMDIKLVVKDYKAKCELTKLYDNTCYNLDGTDADKPMYGGKFIALDAETGLQIPTGNAYLTVPMMRQALVDALYGGNGEQGVGATGKQVLYLDYTDLYSVHIPNKAEMNEMKSKLNPNCLLYFPERSNYNEDNYIQKTKSGDFRACKNIVITDRQPFYAPYKITVPNENYATYTREITIPKNGKVAHASIILPFTLSLENGVHTNTTDDRCSFKVTKMRPTDCLVLDNSEDTSARNYYASAKFDLVGGTATEANVPYMVEVIKAPQDDKISFIATQYGSEVMATTGTQDNPKYTYKGESAEGTIAGSKYNFTNYGSYSGKKVDKNASSVFYFARNMFLSSKNLLPSYQYVYVYPFRAYYLYNRSNQGSKEMIGFEVVTDDAEWETTGITDLTLEADLALQAGKGYISATAKKSVHLDIYNTNGMKVEAVTLNAGESRMMMLPAGLYIVNGKKIIVN
ncbi:MAG: hypothetical protein ACTTJJ_07220 [Prevotella fusca]|uniref:hypothetical protein n=1 Tax=Prevotella fusca TaxID=589436 RepID=UPI003F9FB78A